MENKSEDMILADIEALRQQASLIALFNQAKSMYQQGRTANAEVLVYQILDKQPNDTNANYLLGLIAGRRGQYELAEQLISIAINGNSKDPGVFLDYAAALSGLGRIQEAIKAYNTAIQLDPKSSIAYCKYGSALISIGRMDEAEEALKTALRYNPKLATAKHLLASIGSEELPPQAPPEYVKDLFDSYAERFDKDLVDTLGYESPQHLFNAVSKHIENNSNSLDILDLGCGTGLSGAAFLGVANHLIGVDLSARMIAKAREKGVYTGFIQADAHQALEQINQKFDLILSADVFVYIGNLDGIFDLAVERLNDGGIFAFTIEINSTGEDYLLTKSGRYAQSLEYIRRIAMDNGFQELACNNVALRYEKGMPVSGCAVVLRLPGNCA